MPHVSVVTRALPDHSGAAEAMPRLEYRWDDWKDDYGGRLFAGLTALLFCSERACLGPLAARPAGMTGAE